ncbi:MAG: flagellar basal body-associated FliL family protein [Desulfobacterales bacterium]|uniref:Flagellar protein FliL n=1 Tax=Candidatus Desulfatibia vada TaxID=2841696 RepID=A0A8J6P8J6_9BACT|nr:flagellar basal body-associated FliL family protein [Candidatus Desulfatibia vada]MBL6970821.1 flagellar basal body-associated FliL family protein [Desulfobacterales bacterium]
MTADKDNIKEYDNPEFGIELDKLEVPEVASIPVSKKPVETPIYEEPEETEPEVEVEVEVDVETESQKGLRFKLIVAAATILVLAALFLFLNHKAIKPLLISELRVNSTTSSNEYHTLGPIITNLGENRHIEISLKLRYRTELKEQNSAIESLIRDSILMFLNSPDTQQKVNESDLVKLKLYINNSLTNFLKNDYGDEVILKELKVY